MKKDKLSFLVLLVEIAAIIFLHSAKNRHTQVEVAQGEKNAPATYQLKVLPVAKVK